MATMPATFGAPAAAGVPRDQCPNEKYCDEREHGRPECPPTRCRYGGYEHDKVPCPHHDRPFGLDAGQAETPAAPTEAKPKAKPKPKRRRPARKPARRPAKGKRSARKPARGKTARKAKRKPAKKKRK